MADSTIASHVDGQRSVGRDGAGCVGKWPVDAGHGTNAKFPENIIQRKLKPDIGTRIQIGSPTQWQPGSEVYAKFRAKHLGEGRKENITLQAFTGVSKMPPIKMG